MPEGDTVWRTARSLDQALSGTTLTGVDFRVPELATVDLTGQMVHETLARGKHLLTRIGDDHTLHTHLKMEGSWHLYRPETRWRRPRHEARVVLRTPRWNAVGFALGVVELLARDDEDSAVGHLGPDLLGPDWDAGEAVQRLMADPDRPLNEALLDQRNLAGALTPSTVDRTIGEALLDQRNLAGIGTVYMSESLFLAGVSPLTPVHDVADISRVVLLAHRLMAFNKERSVQVTTGNMRRGQEHYVYLRAGEQCRRCGDTIVTDMVGKAPRDRRTYWCPSCQP